jgi:hypothetical protein
MAPPPPPRQRRSRRPTTNRHLIIPTTPPARQTFESLIYTDIYCFNWHLLIWDFYRFVLFFCVYLARGCELWETLHYTQTLRFLGGGGGVEERWDWRARLLWMETFSWIWAVICTFV